MIQLKATVKNILGIHARPAALIVQAASKFHSEIFLTKDGMEVNGKSIMGVMMLAAEPDSEILIKVQGDDEDRAAPEMARVIESKFD